VWSFGARSWKAAAYPSSAHGPSNLALTPLHWVSPSGLIRPETTKRIYSREAGEYCGPQTSPRHVQQTNLKIDDLLRPFLQAVGASNVKSRIPPLVFHARLNGVGYSVRNTPTTFRRDSSEQKPYATHQVRRFKKYLWRRFLLWVDGIRPFARRHCLRYRKGTLMCAGKFFSLVGVTLWAETSGWWTCPPGKWYHICFLDAALLDGGRSKREIQHRQWTNNLLDSVMCTLGGYCRSKKYHELEVGVSPGLNLS